MSRRTECEHHYWENAFFFQTEKPTAMHWKTRREKKKKKVELPQNKQIFSSVSGSLERIKQAFLYWTLGRTFMLSPALVPIYAAGFYTSTSGGHSNFRLLTEPRPENPTPSSALTFEFVSKHGSNHCFCPWGEDSSESGDRNSTSKDKKASWGCQHPSEETISSCGVKAGERATWEGGCYFLLVLGDNVVHG